MFSNDILSQELSDYVSAFSSDEPEYLTYVREKTEKEMHQPHMISGAFQGRFLSLISKLVKPKNILEIGTFTGYATLCLAEGLSENGKITTIDRDERVAEFYKPVFKNSNFSDKINAILVDAIEFLKNYTGEKWDLVFLDANKRKYVEYVELLLPQIESGGLILADNVLWKNKVLNNIDSKDKITKSLHEFNTFVKEDRRIEAVMLPIRDGLTMIRKI